MRLLIFIFIVAGFTACKRYVHCENATVYKSQRCGVEWEVQFNPDRSPELNGNRYPAQNLPNELKRDGNQIEVYDYHFYTDPRLCACCGYTWLVVDKAEDELICL